MTVRLLVAVLGARSSGKSHTWNCLFGTTVKTGKQERPLYLNNAQRVSVFLVSGSPQERQIEVEHILYGSLPRIVLCSTQYHQDVNDTYDYFFDNDYEVFIQWLNPGYHDNSSYQDDLQLQDYLLGRGATLQVRDGRIDAMSRVRELRQTILGWATYHNLVHTEFQA